MIKQAMIAAALLGAVPALAAGGPGNVSPRNPDSAHRPASSSTAPTGIGASISAPIPGAGIMRACRANACASGRNVAISFLGARGGNFDRYGMIRVDGWRCPVASVVEFGTAAGPARLSAAPSQARCGPLERRLWPSSISIMRR